MRLLLIVFSVLTFSAHAQVSIYGNDGTYLSNLSANKYDPNSTSNPYGQYGSKYSPNSINNPYSKWGSKYSPYSVTNPYAISPSKLIGQHGVHGDF